VESIYTNIIHTQHKVVSLRPAPPARSIYSANNLIVFTCYEGRVTQLSRLSISAYLSSAFHSRYMTAHLHDGSVLMMHRPYGKNRLKEIYFLNLHKSSGMI
jgi:hypothetical protein